MYNEFGGTLSNLALAKHRKSRAINAENPRGCLLYTSPSPRD